MFFFLDIAYGASPPRHFCLLHNKSNKSGSASVADAIAYFLKFQYLTNMYAKLRRSRKSHGETSSNSELYQNYLNGDVKSKDTDEKDPNINNNTLPKNEVNSYCTYLDEAIFGSSVVMHNVNMDHLVVKKNNKGLVPKLFTCDDERQTSGEIIRHNLEKVQFYEQSQTCDSTKDIFVSLSTVS